MLVLTRRPGESIIIANNIKITVVNVGPGRVKLGIEAPANVRVDRQEIHDKMEIGSDVLSAVAGGEASREAATDAQNTLVGHGPDTATIVTVPATTTEAAQTPTAPPAQNGPPFSKLNKLRLPPNQKPKPR